MSRPVFWFSLIMIVYPYFGYPLVLYFLRKIRVARNPNGVPSGEFTPTVTVLIPVHNEEGTIESKIRNTLSLEYPRKNLQIIAVSDGSTDSTPAIVRKYLGEGVTFIAMERRRGKAQALNTGLAAATGDIVVFTDVSILLEPDSLRAIVKRFREDAIGCVSGSDCIPGGGGEGIYGRYELFLRNMESAVHSIVGASGSFYAQRRSICPPFLEGMAPDFLSALTTVEKGYRAVTESTACGHMASAKQAKDEFRRKERTILRGMTTLYQKKNLLNPYRYGIFSFFLWSHKVSRWLVPFFMILLFLLNAFLLEERFYGAIFIAQCAFYLAACVPLLGTRGSRNPLSNMPHYFCLSNAAILFATMKYAIGIRQEIWTPTKR
ncbi:MAG: glycosyltransferase family 2 protein [Deltaproteobacteria bacterium]|nr:MAG: glycosyltransferase family 2 protein [Deltaproteobacteria bacterium]